MSCKPEPTQIRAGTTIKWERTESEYQDGWTGAYKLNAAALAQITIPTTRSGAVYTVDQKPNVTDVYAAGAYTWIFSVTDGTDTFIADSGFISIIAFNATGNPLADAQKYLDQAEQELAERTTGKPSSYSIKDRSLTRMSADELIRAVSYWRQRVNILEAKTERERCRTSTRRITYARFR